jgi:hypothetical protein
MIQVDFVIHYNVGAQRFKCRLTSTGFDIYHADAPTTLFFSIPVIAAWHDMTLAQITDMAIAKTQSKLMLCRAIPERVARL